MTAAVIPRGDWPPVAVRLTEWDSLKPGTDGQSRLVRGLSFDSDRVRATASALEQCGVVVLTELRDGLSIETRSFVGRIRVGPLDITIVPKISWSRWLTVIGYGLRLRGLQRTQRLPLPTHGDALRDLLVLELIHEARDLIARGLHREYERVYQSLSAPRGRVDFDHLIRQGGLRSASVPCQFTRRSPDVPLNQALLGGLRLASLGTQDTALRSLAGRLAQEMDMSVRATPMSADVLRQARGTLDRRTTRYGPSLDLIALLHEGLGLDLPTSPNGQLVPMPGFALDMNKLWQRVVLRVLTEWTTGLHIEDEYHLRGLLRSNPEFPLRKRPPMPRPDFGLFKHERLLGFLDAKYRDLWETSLPSGMLYQLALYATVQRSGAAAMLYPTDSPRAAEERIDICDPTSGAIRASVAMRPVRLGILESLISAKPSAERADARRLFAEELVTGFSSGPASGTSAFGDQEDEYPMREVVERRDHQPSQARHF